MTARDIDPGEDWGSSLAELLVSIMVFGMVAVVVTTAIMMTLNTSRATTTRADDLSAAQTSLDAMSKLIQTAAQPPAVEGAIPAAAVISATADDLKFYGYNAPGQPPAEIEFSVANSELTETVTPSTNTGPNACLPPYTYGAGTSRVLATGINSTAAVFSYYAQPTSGDLDGVVLPLMGLPASLSADDLAAVELVTINLSVAEQGHPTVTATNATTTVALPNHLVISSNLPASAC